MLREIKKINQKRGEPRKRWFTDLSMDVFVWFNDEGEIIGYHLTYNKPHDEKAIVWSKDKGFEHLGVDDGSRPGKHPGSPILVKDGVVNSSEIISMLRNNKGDLEPWIIGFVVDGIKRYFK